MTLPRERHCRKSNAWISQSKPPKGHVHKKWRLALIGLTLGAVKIDASYCRKSACVVFSLFFRHCQSQVCTKLYNPSIVCNGVFWSDSNMFRLCGVTLGPWPSAYKHRQMATSRSPTTGGFIGFSFPPPVFCLILRLSSICPSSAYRSPFVVVVVSNVSSCCHASLLFHVLLSYFHPTLVQVLFVVVVVESPRA